MTDLLDLMRHPPIERPIVANEDVVKGEVDETLRLEHPSMAWDRARIELHQHTDGLWMWSVSFGLDLHDGGGLGGGYRVGPKRGRFAESRDDALHWAVNELLDRLGDRDRQDAKAIRAWARGLA